MRLRCRHGWWQYVRAAASRTCNRFNVVVVFFFSDPNLALIVQSRDVHKGQLADGLSARDALALALEEEVLLHASEVIPLNRRGDSRQPLLGQVDTACSA